MTWTAELISEGTAIFVADRYTYEEAVDQALSYARAFRDPPTVVITVKRTT